MEELSAIARPMAERTAASWTSVPHFFVVREVDAGALVEAREPLGGGVTHTDLLIALVARVLVPHPRLNASWTPERIRANDAVNISVAVAVADGVALTT